MAGPRLRLRRLSHGDEAAAVAAHHEMLPEGFEFLFWWTGQPWSQYLLELEAVEHGHDLGPGLVPATFLVAEVDGQLVGRVSIRHRLNERLSSYGGHIGYGVRPGYRRRGLATEMLRQSLVIARGLGIERALLTCADDNASSAVIIERCGGVLESVDTTTDGRSTRRYWVDTRQSPAWADERPLL